MKIGGNSCARRRSRISKSAVYDVERLMRKKCGGGNLLRRRLSPIQTLFLACNMIFRGSGTSPSSAQVRLIHTLLDRMTSEDVDLNADIPFFKCKAPVEGAAGVSCTTIYQCKNFSICLFFMPPGSVIPLHDHPGMTVFSKLLLGSMHARSYDFIDHPHPSQEGRQRRLAKLTMDSELMAPCKSSVLFPEAGGNIHDFTAITPCAILDIMGPPYSAEEDRDITYYKCLPFSEIDSEKVAGEGDEELYRWLEEIDMPKEAAMASVAYLGPPIFDS